MTLRPGVFVGRQTEIGELYRVLDSTRSGFGGATFVVGEAGIGKSRLVREVTRHALTMGMPVLRGRGSTIGPMVPFRPLVEALLGVLRRGLLPADGRFGPEGPVLGPYRPVLGRLIPDWAGDNAASDGSVIVLAEAVLRLLSIIGTENGCLLALDDLQDADAETLAVVEYLIDNVDAQSTMLLGTFRPDGSAAVDLVGESARRGACTLLRLGPLSFAEVRELAVSLLNAKDDLPTELIELLCESCAGNPFVAEEILDSMVSDSLIVRGPGGWQFIGDRRLGVPTTVARSITRRTDQLGEKGRALLSCAAVLGQRFALSIVQRVTGLDDHSLLSHLRSGVAAQLVVSDVPAPDWYAFRHPLTVEALLAELSPRQLVDLSTRAADAIEQLHPELPGQWCQMVASLRLQAGDSHRAARQLTEAGRRALADGAPNSASSLLRRAADMLDASSQPDALADVLEALIPALVETGGFDQGLALNATVEELGAAGLAPARLAVLHTALAKVAYVAGRFEEGVAQVEAARLRLGDEPADEQAAPMDTTAAYLALDLYPTRQGNVEELARRAIAAAERVPLPEVACEGWQFLGMLARERDINEARACLHRAREIAEEHQLRIQRMYVLVRLGGLDWLCESDSSLLGRVRQDALEAGAVTLSHSVDAILALDTVLRGDFARAAQLIDECLDAVTRFQAVAVVRYVLMVRAVLFSHQGRRREMEAAIAEFNRNGGVASQEEGLIIGLGQVFCALVEEDRATARQQLARVVVQERENPSRFYLAGEHGVRLLLDVLDGRAGWSEFDTTVSSPVAGFRWNRQFVGLARAVLLGRDGRTDEANRAFDAAAADAADYPLVAHLGLRLVVEAAYADGWGDPITWLRRAEDYFHEISLPGPASACRQLLREYGASVQQRRSGIDRVPAALRSLGVTVREFEVFELVAQGAGNKAIAGRLHISPRTAEKHVASLIGKTGQPDRSTLNEFAAAVLEQVQD